MTGKLHTLRSCLWFAAKLLVTLLGPSGSGKSTFLTAVGLINPPTHGQVSIGGQLVLNGPQAQANLRIVVTHDHRALDVFDTVYEMEDGLLRPAEPVATTT